MAIAEIAFLLGFSEASAFHRVFERWCGRTPAECRGPIVVAPSETSGEENAGHVFGYRRVLRADRWRSEDGWSGTCTSR
jgi:AraC-like DNA-binding protein